MSNPRGNPQNLRPRAKGELLPSLPIAPLVALVEAAGGLPDVHLRGKIARTWHRGRHSGRLTYGAADRLAVALLDKHPCEVWGADWWTDEPAE